MIAKNIMTPFEKLITVGGGETIFSAIYKMEANNVGSVLIMTDDLIPLV